VRGRFYLGEPVAMRRPTELVPLDRTMQLPLALAGELRTTFADVVSSPLPDRLTALMRRLQSDRDERSGRSANGASTTETSRRIDRRGRS
jgi:anti-sigma factor NepR-like protein